jgi:2-oxoglutarate/2-oxoacid ferredoxin oxidoreductase subunit alpha
MAEFKELSAVVVRFAGDSGDGMQIAGERFTDSSALFGNDVATFPDYPAEIRAPAGTIPGVSAFQVHFGSRRVMTMGDELDALVAMNPAALAVHLKDLSPGGLLLVNTAAFTADNLKMAGFADNPLDDPDLQQKYELIAVDISGLTRETLKDSPLRQRDQLRCKNFFALGFMYWVYSRPLQVTIDFLERKWRKSAPDLADANIAVLKAGYHLGDTMETRRHRYQVNKAATAPGTYRKIAGNDALVLGLVAGARQAQRNLFYSGYPITPASSILEGLAAYKNAGVKVVQAEDEIAAIGIALGASYAGSLGVTATSGPGMCLKAEFIGLAISTELPLVIINVQRGGPSTGLPTKTEQADLLQALYGRHGESPLPVLAAHSPSDCFQTALEACRLALKYSTPVILLSDLSVANGAEPWRIPAVETLPDLQVPVAQAGQPYVTFGRHPETLARTQAIPGTPGLEHRIGGLEKDTAGGVNYSGENHQKMTELRAAKIEAISSDLPPMRLTGAETGDLLVVSWGGTYGAVTAAIQHLQTEGYAVSGVHLRYLNPLHSQLGALLAGFRRIVVPELNSGQLAQVLQARYALPVTSFVKMQGQPFRVSEIRENLLTHLTA